MYGGGTIFPGAVSRQEEYSDDAFMIALGVGVRSPEFWNQRFAKLDLGYYTGKAVNSGWLRFETMDEILYSATKFFDSFWDYNKTLTYKDFERMREVDIDYIGVRGPLSSRRLSKYGIDHQVVGDTALALQPSPDLPKKNSRIAVCIRNNTYGWASNDYHEVVIELCQRYADEYEFVFLPFWPPDIEVCLRAARAVPNASFRDYCSSVNVQAVIDEIAQCDLLIGDKLHANVLSACSYTPFISLEYRPKNLDFAKSIGMAEFNIRTNEVDINWLNNKFKRAVSSDELPEKLKNEVEQKRESLKNFCGRVSADMPK